MRRRLIDLNERELAEFVLGKTKRVGTCLIWQGKKSLDGYGEVRYQNTSLGRVHRITYSGLVGPIPEGHHIDHLCRVRDCVNVDHLEAVTPRENWLRGISTSRLNALKTHCKRGHEFTPENTYWHAPKRARHCRTCQRERNARRRSERDVA